VRERSAAALPARARVAGRLTAAVGATSRRLGLGGGSVIGGRVGLALAPDLLGTLARGRTVGLVSGTNGKTTTTRLLAAALGGPGAVATSGAGANLPPGLVSALATAAPGAPAVLEVDEGYLGAVARAVHPAVITLLNLSRDQLDRVSEVRMVAERWRRLVGDLAGTTVVANADDPLVVFGALGAPALRWVAAGALWRLDAVGCPACGGRIVFDPDGDWHCGCGFRRPTPEVTLEGDVLVTADGRRRTLALGLPGRCNRANAAMAATAAEVLGVDLDDALAAMGGVVEVEGRFATARHGGVEVRLLLAKNPAGWTELLDLVEGGADPVVVGINARVADGHDPSWLWDVPFERLAGRLVVATGERRRDLAVRLRHAGVRHLTVADQAAALGAAGAPRVEYVGNYTAFQDLRRSLGRPGPGAGPAPTRAPVPGVVVPPPGTPVPEVVAGRGGGSPRPRGRGESALRVVVVHPDLLGTYGDGGNGRVLAGRAAWRGTAVELVLAPSDAPLPSGADVYLLGGGEDGPQVQSADLLRRGELATAVEAGAVVLAGCAGYQVVGTAFPDAEGRPHPGVGLLEVTTVRGTGPRSVGELAAEPLGPSPGAAPDPVPLATLTGFENHAAVTRLGPGVLPLGRVVAGVGNGAGGAAPGDGARSGRVVGTYLHGPVLARNPSLADLLLAWATGSVPSPLDDSEEEALRRERLGALPGSGARPPGSGARVVLRQLTGARRGPR